VASSRNGNLTYRGAMFRAADPNGRGAGVGRFMPRVIMWRQLCLFGFWRGASVVLPRAGALRGGAMLPAAPSLALDWVE
jgi:hypothetical protein